MSTKPLLGKVALVTGATRGIGKGIALHLSQAGALVYITGRTLKSTNGLGSLEETANQIRERGGECIPIQCDHSKDEDIRRLFDQINSDQNGRLDILINNAFTGVNAAYENGSTPFWEQRPEVWDDYNNVGLRNHYICTVYGARLMVPRKQGLIVNVSSYGGFEYLFQAAYGPGKAAVDRMAVDCGIELKEHNITMFSLYPGPARTELVLNLKSEPKSKGVPSNFSKRVPFMDAAFENGESLEFCGKVVVKMAQDPKISQYTSKAVFASEYAAKHGIRDIDGRLILGYRQIKWVASIVLPDKWKFIVNFIPSWIKIPKFLLAIKTSKF